MAAAWRLVRLLVSWENLLRNRSSCLSSSGVMLSDAMAGAVTGVCRRRTGNTVVIC